MQYDCDCCGIPLADGFEGYAHQYAGQHLCIGCLEWAEDTPWTPEDIAAYEEAYNEGCCDVDLIYRLTL